MHMNSQVFDEFEVNVTDYSNHVQKNYHIDDSHVDVTDESDFVKVHCQGFYDSEEMEK